MPKFEWPSRGNGIRIQPDLLYTRKMGPQANREDAINAYREIIRKEGYLPPVAAETLERTPGMLKFG